MKKIISLITILFLLTMLVFTTNCYAASLDTVSMEVNKTIVRPAEEVKVTIQFGQSLGAYTFDISYDNNIFEYVSVDGGTANNTGDKVKVTYYDSTGGSNPRSNMSVIFKAKSDITTSNPTEFTATAEGLANADASVTFDDITSPMVKNVTVEPQYVDYQFKLEYTGDIIKEEEKQMKISYVSSMGRYYEHARLIVEATTPAGANLKLIATDNSNIQHDIINSGWGDPQGEKIGGKNVSQVLNAKALFSQAGKYDITFKLIDRDNSDQVIASQKFSVTVKDEKTTEQTTQKPNNGQQANDTNVNKDKTPTKLPQTGINVYIAVIASFMIVLTIYVYVNKRN